MNKLSLDNSAEWENQDIQKRLEQMFNEHRERLLRMIEIRLMPELRKHLDPVDVLQDAFLEACRQLTGKISAPKSEPIIWLRLIVSQQLIALHRKYCQSQKRNIHREVSMNMSCRPESDSLSLSGFLVGKLTAPSFAARRHELIIKLREALDDLGNDDREILSLRHFEQLSNSETAEELNISPNTASVRYIRALKKFRDVLKSRQLDDLLEYSK
ncbi:MAG: sigma-70 family RNA polymerase sigma factor [Planctomycetia bacterium]|nr:sigma-70 family RNA polymerase sigma factor [Planctomycetia bacterium]